MPPKEERRRDRTGPLPLPLPKMGRADRQSREVMSFACLPRGAGGPGGRLVVPPPIRVDGAGEWSPRMVLEEMKKRNGKTSDGGTDAGVSLTKMK
jgi:hypothetical protein